MAKCKNKITAIATQTIKNDKPIPQASYSLNLKELYSLNADKPINNTGETIHNDVAKAIKGAAFFLNVK